jgi:hypothetical protein
VAALSGVGGSVHLHATDGDGEWFIETGDGLTWTRAHEKGDVAVRGTTSDLLLLVWGRLGTDAVEGALWITKCPSVHMMGMRYPIDVAVVDRDGRVLKVATLKPWVGGTRPRLKATATIEAPAGALATWGVGVGSRLAYEVDDSQT